MKQALQKAGSVLFAGIALKFFTAQHIVKFMDYIC